MINTQSDGQSKPNQESVIGSQQKSSEKDQIIDVESESLTVKQKTGDVINLWFEKNRSLVLRQTPVWAQTLVLIIISLGTITVIGGIFFRIDEVVTVNGQLKSVGGTIEVKTPAGGRISEVLFKDGEYVKKNQLLLRFDTREATRTRETLSRLIALEEQQLQNQLKTLRIQKDTVEGREAVMINRINTKKIAVKEMEKLVQVGGFQRLQFLERKDQLLELDAQLSELRQQRSSLDLQESQVKLASDKSIDQMQRSLQSAELQLQYQTVKSPVSGIIFDPQASLEGVLSPGERILSVVPQSGLFAEVYVPNSDIGFIKLGQSSKIRVSAFPFTRYGELKGSVTQIGADALPPNENQSFYRYPVKLKLETSYLERKGVKIPLKPGMAIVSNLKLRDKPVISLVSDLLVDQTDSIKSIRQQ